MERQGINMSEDEFEVLDQLYFITPYNDLIENLNYEDEILLDTIWLLVGKGWIKCFESPDIEIEPDEHTLRINYMKYKYLASKQGLLAHNSR